MPLNQQLLLEFQRDLPASIDEFVAGRNLEAVASIRAMIEKQAGLRQIHLWGDEGSGRTHLLVAAAAANGRYLACGGMSDLARFEWTPEVALWALDDLHIATAAEQSCLFTLINEVRGAASGVILSSSNVAPLYLNQLRDDLRTRLGWGLVFRLHPLDDRAKDEALQQRAAQRGLSLGADVRHYLLTHFSRDLANLLRLVDALDRFALEQHRAVTVPLVREWLLESEGNNRAS